MKKYNVTIQRILEQTFNVEADDEDEALELAEEKFDCLDHIYGDELFYHNHTIEEEQ